MRVLHFWNGKDTVIILKRSLGVFINGRRKVLLGHHIRQDCTRQPWSGAGLLLEMNACAI